MKERKLEVIKYLIVGACTTLLNFVVFYILYNVFLINYIVANMVAWIISVIFAYLTNKKIVFHTRTESFMLTVKEVLRFFTCRIASLIIEQLLMFVLVSILVLNANLSKIGATITIVIINYIFSKLVVFKNNHSGVIKC